MTHSAASGDDTRRPLPPPPAALAEWLLAQEADAKPGFADRAAAGERAYLRLRARLAVLLGAAGFDALWARALSMAQSILGADDTPAATDTAPLDASGLRAAMRGRDAATAQQATLAVFTRFISLLFTFIGEELGTRFIRQLWPEPPPDATDSPAEEAAND